MLQGPPTEQEDKQMEEYNRIIEALEKLRTKLPDCCFATLEKLSPEEALERFTKYIEESTETFNYKGESGWDELLQRIEDKKKQELEVWWDDQCHGC